MKASIKDNEDKVKANKLRPYLVANIVELLDLPTEEESEDLTSGTMSVDSQVRRLYRIIK
jgi:hypothetical protein